MKKGLYKIKKACIIDKALIQNSRSYVRLEGAYMKEIFQEYGGILITIVAILSVLAVITAVIGSDANGVVGRAFTTLINNFVSQAGGAS